MTMRILLAEDDAAMRHYLKRALRQAGYQVDAVDRGTEAVPLLRSQTYDLLLSDIVMPEMDGIALAQKCAEISPLTRVMFITGFAAVSLTMHDGTGQPARMLSKPFHLKALVSEIERLFTEEAPLASH
jgi:two-component system, cell cycle response regulator CpdR